MRLKEMIKAFISFRQINDTFVLNWQNKEIWTWGNVIKEETNFVYIVFSALNSLFLMISVSLYLLVQGGYLSHGTFISSFQGDKGESECFALAAS